MKIAEKIIASLVLIGFILKMMHIPGGSPLLIVSACILSLFYMFAGYFLFKTSDEFKVVNGNPHKSESMLRILGSIATGMSLSTTIIGIEFRVMHWPGALTLLIIGIFSLVAIGAVSAFKYSQTKSKFYEKVGLRLAIIGGLGLLLIFVEAP